MEQKQRVEHYVQLLDEITERVGDSAVAARVMQEVAKDRRMALIREERGHENRSASRNNVDEPATEKQFEYLRDLGMNPPEGLSKDSASKLIDDALAKKAA